MRLLVITIYCISALLINGCATTENKTDYSKNGTQSENETESKSKSKSSYVLRGKNYSLAIYNNEHRLLTNPIEDLLTEMKWRKITRQSDITDIYIVSHGWNYTHSTAIANYHNYIEMVDEYMKGKEKTEKFQPYFIFVNWISAVRPTTSFVKGILPFGIDSAVEPITNLMDRIPLHLFTGWKQSLNATHNALGTHYPNHYQGNIFSYKLHTTENESEYGYKDDNMLLDADILMGSSLSLSALIYKLIQTKASPFNENDEDCSTHKFDRFNPKSDKCVSLAGVKLHAIGHSYGAKLVTIASMEALRRWMLDSIGKCILGDKDVINCDKYKYDQLNLSKPGENPVYLKDLDLTSEILAISPYTGHVEMAREILDIIGIPREKEPLLLKRFYKETTELPIESLVLFNPAFHPGELSYPVDLIYSAPVETLKFIPRKAIVFTRHDYANGALFGFSGAIFNTQLNQWYQQLTSDFNQHYLAYSKNWSGITKAAATPLMMTLQAFIGSLSLGNSVAYNQIGQATYGIVNFPLDFWHHVKTGTEGSIFLQKAAPDLNIESFSKGIVNAIDFFLPIYPYIFSRNESEQGLFRISRPGLGKTGLNHLAAGRYEELNLAGLSSYYLSKVYEPLGKMKCIEEVSEDCIETKNTISDDQEHPFSPNIDAKTFFEFSKELNLEANFEDNDLLWQREKFYSFDASQVYNSRTLLVGAHSDLRSSKCTDPNLKESECMAAKSEKRDHTFNFILKFTKTNFNKELKK